MSANPSIRVGICLRRNFNNQQIALRQGCVLPVTTHLQGLQIMACGPNAARQAISSARKTHFANDEKVIYTK